MPIRKHMVYFILLISVALIAASFRKHTVLKNFDQSTTLPLRGMLAIGIVLHHLAQRYVFGFDIGGHTLSLIEMFAHMGAPIVAVFFFLTGYGLAKSLSIKGTAYTDSFLSKRLGKILPEFIGLTLAVTIALIATGLSTGPVILDKMSHGNPPLPSSWFMYAITYSYIAFYLSARLARAHLMKTLLFFAIFTAVYIVLVHVLDFGGWWSSSIVSIVMGYAVAVKERAVTALLTRRWVVRAFVVIMFLCLVASLLRLPVPGLKTIYIYLFALATYVCVRFYGVPQFRALIFLGDISLNIYLVHYIFIDISRMTPVNPYLALVLVFTAAILSAYALKLLRAAIEPRISRKTADAVGR